jgi:predicted AlkP superfamily phosphohydrolase/phosphomutase
MDALRSLEGPDGTRPFTQVRLREAVYEGDATAFAPDIILEQANEYVIGSSRPRGQTFIPAEEGRIDHTRHGLLVAAGPDIEPGWSLAATPSIMDVTPTLLALAGVPLDERFDGEPLVDLFAAEPAIERREYGPIETGDAYAFSDDEEAALEERLGAMGYME